MDYVVAVTGDELAALEDENWIGYLTGVASCTARAPPDLHRNHHSTLGPAVTWLLCPRCYPLPRLS
jgi:hypothetical protein